MSYRIPQHIRSALMGEAARLSFVIDEAVRLSFRTADLECRDNPGEVDKVLSFFIEGLDLIENEFNRLLHPRRVHLSVSGIFTHQTPKVELLTVPRFGGRRCELADLCLLVTYGAPLERRGLGNALLLQAKNDFESDLDEVQCALYEEEIRFRYHSPSTLADPKPVERNLPPKGEPALAYWGLGRWYRYHLPYEYSTSLLWASEVAGRHKHPRQFGGAIFDVLRGAAGYGFRRPSAKEEGWSKTLFDLITVTATQAAVRQNMGVRGRQRGCGRLARQLLQQSYAKGSSYVVRNSLAETLAFYSPELRAAGTAIEKQAQKWVDEKLAADEEPAPGGRRGEGHVGNDPPLLRNERPAGPDDGGGGGNWVLFHFTQMQ
jgi:hypothetical protein